jgi:hypothetical protein
LYAFFISLELGKVKVKFLCISIEP